MTREQIREHYADVVRAVYRAEDNVKPTLMERWCALGKKPTQEQKIRFTRDWCLAVADELLSATSDEELKELYKD